MNAIRKTKRTGSQCVSVTLPELLQLANDAKQLSLSASRIGRSQSGQHLSKFLGRGMEFAESRLYQAGDDIRTIDWRVTARAGKPHTKLFAVEKERQVLLWGDLRSPMYFATKGILKCIQSALLMGYVAWNTVQTGNRIGGMLFNENEHFEFKPYLGKKGILPLLQSLAERANFQAKPSSDGLKASVMDQAIANLIRVANPGSLLFLVSDFRHFSSFGEELLIQASEHSDICLCFIYDPFEASLPRNGNYPITDGKNKLQLNTYDQASLQKYENLFLERKNRVKALSRQRHIYYLECSTEHDCLEVLKQTFI